MLQATHDDPTQRTTPTRSASRTCVGCRAEDTKAALVRFAFDGARLVPDVRGRLGGRGVWVHATRACVRSAVKSGGFARVLRSQSTFDVDSLVESLAAEHRRQAESLLSGARRARLGVVGSDECLDALAQGRAFVAVVSADARASRDAVRAAAERAGVPVAVLGTNQSLGRCFLKDEVGVAVVCDRALADSISQVATRIATLSEGE